MQNESVNTFHRTVKAVHLLVKSQLLYDNVTRAYSPLQFWGFPCQRLSQPNAPLKTVKRLCPLALWRLLGQQSD